jgi:hypothetical protein
MLPKYIKGAYHHKRTPLYVDKMQTVLANTRHIIDRGQIKSQVQRTFNRPLQILAIESRIEAKYQD